MGLILVKDKVIGLIILTMSLLVFSEGGILVAVGKITENEYNKIAMVIIGIVFMVIGFIVSVIDFALDTGMFKRRKQNASRMTKERN